MAQRKKQVRRIVRYKTPEDCPFCLKDDEPDYKKFKDLGKYISERSRIIGTDITGVCSRHQRHLARAIKRARHLGLLSFNPQ